ncbi:YgcG family protein [Pseudomonas aeruginosa]|uniref:TPM domain-containing protein n=1 Tax=Pseudomonas aeruginosa TaxID=287 RepID=UPI00040124A7|nr:YgcG family protein [Pseudomonas aeruginosa]MBG6563795.1 YgcG family protein [Pseudomonas aeruginosa]MBH3912941.1 YgcG family protein [Pseudomonas aeruginosa]MBH3922751.1 YgcG family protein [Pseudomonas aeruginosa]MDG4404651.1 YgcG family protein [Pseudomonas aeruginosa]MDV6874160.1 YgcG family protein [Pseudomonas aeruginosa]
MRRLLLGAGLLLASLVAWADVPPIPALTARVTDLTATLSGDQRQHLEQQLAALEAKSGAQLAVLLVPTTGDDSIEEYAVRTFEKWKLGQKKVDDGVLLLVAKNDRTLRIEVGYGLEGAITDVQAGRIISEQITPQFRQGNFYGGIQAGVDSLVQLIDAEKNPESATASAPVDALPAVPEATPPRALPPPVDEGEVYDSAPPEPKKKSGLSGQLWGNPVYLGVYVAVLLAVALLGRLLPLQWMRRRSIGRFLLCSAAVAGLAWLLSMGLWQNVDRAADDSLGVLAPTLFIYALFLLPGEVLMAILSAILNSRGRGGGGGSGGGSIFRGGGGSSGGGGASGRW